MASRFESDRVFAQSDKIVARAIGEEYVLVPVNETTVTEHIYTLDSTARFIWEQIDGERSVADLVDAVCGEYEGDRGYIGRTVDEFIGDLCEIGAIVEKSTQG